MISCSRSFLLKSQNFPLAFHNNLVVRISTLWLESCIILTLCESALAYRYWILIIRTPGLKETSTMYVNASRCWVHRILSPSASCPCGGSQPWCHIWTQISRQTEEEKSSKSNQQTYVGCLHSIPDHLCLYLAWLFIQTLVDYDWHVHLIFWFCWVCIKITCLI